MGTRIFILHYHEIEGERQTPSRGFESATLRSKVISMVLTLVILSADVTEQSHESRPIRFPFVVCANPFPGKVEALLQLKRVKMVKEIPTTSIRNYSVSSALIILRSFGVLSR